MKKIHKILLIALCLTLVVSAVVVVPLSASAAAYPEIPADPYSDVTAPAGYYYFYSTLDGFDSIGNFTQDFTGNACYFLNYRVRSLEKKNEDLKMSYYDSNGDLFDIVIYNSNTGWNYTGLIYNRTPSFYITRDLNVAIGFSRILKYRSYNQSLLVSGVYSLKDFAGVDSSIWKYTMSGEFYVDGLLYNTMTIDKENGFITLGEASTLRSKFIYADDPNRSDYRFEIPLAYVTQSVYNNFYNLFDKIGSYGNLIESKQYYHFADNFSYVNSFLSNVSIDRAYCPTSWVRNDGTVLYFDYLTANNTGIYGCNAISGGSYTELVKIYDSSTSSLGDYSLYFSAQVPTGDNLALVFYSDVSLTVGGANVIDYYELIAYNRGLAESNAGYDQGYSDGYSVGYTAGYNVGLPLGDSQGYERGYGEGFGLGKSSGYKVGYQEGYDKGTSSFSGDIAGWLDTAVGGFMGLELFPGFSIGGIMSVVVGVALLSFFLKLFMGG